MSDPREEEELRAVSLRNAQAIFQARRRAEEELQRVKDELERKSELLEVTLASIGDGVVTLDLEGRVASLNPVAERLTGWREAEAQGRPLAEVLHVLDERSRRPVEVPALSGRDVERLGFPDPVILVSRSGAQTPIEDSVSPILDAVGVAHGQVLVFRSVAERRRAEESSRRSAEELADFFDNASVAMHCAGPDGVIIRANQAELDLLGYAREEYVGRPLADFHVDPEAADALLARLSAGETLRDVPARLRRRDGSILDVLVDASVRREEGRFAHTRTVTRDVTGARRAEEAQARLAAIVASSQDAIASKNLDGIIQSWNGAAEQLFGWRADEIIGRSVLVLIPPERAHEEEAILARLRRGERIEHYETERVRKDGSKVDVSLTISPVRDATGRIVGASKIVRDISARRRAEARLAMQDGVTSRLAEAADLAAAAPLVMSDLCERLAWRVGALWTIDERVDALRCIALHVAPGTSAPLFVAQTRECTMRRGVGLPGRVWESGSAAWIPDVVKDVAFLRAAAAAREGLHAALAFPISLREGMLGVMELFGDAIRPPDDELLRTMTAIGSQLGQFVERKRQEAARRRSEEIVRFLANASAELAAISDQESTLRKVAALAVPSFSDWCGIHVVEGDGSLRRLTISHAEPALASVAREMERVHPGAVSEPRGVGRVVRTGQVEWMSRVPDDALATLARGDEHLRVLRELGCRSYICVPLRSRGRVLGALSFVMGASGRAYDIADVKASEDLASRVVIALENAGLVAALRESDRRKDEFLATLAHELRNPLAPIRNAVQIMRGSTAAPPEVQWSAAVIDRQVLHMTRLVDDLLDMSRITTGKIALRREIVDLATVVANAVEASRPLMEQKGHELSVSLPARPLLVDGDPARLAQVVSNLLNNSAKYTDRGGHVALSLSEAEGLLEIRVKDDGIGIAPEVLPRVFDMFTQGPRSAEHAQGGLGIGLTLVKKIVQLHGGTIEAASAGPGQGTEVVVRLLAAGGDERAAAAAAPHEVGRGAASLRVLVVDDNVDAADSLGMLLGAMGHEARTAHDGLAALDAFEAFRPELVLLDIGLPRLGGEEVARRIRAGEDGDGVHIVAFTGWGQEEDRRRSREAGFDRHVTKPISMEELQQVLDDAALRRSRTAR